MNEMRVASIALAAYLVTSADAMSMKRIRSPPCRVNGAYSSRMTSRTPSSSVPITTRSGRMKSSIAPPSFRNSGLAQMWNGTSVSAAMAARTFAAVPTGTVDLVTMTFGSFRCRPIAPAAASTCERSAEPSSSGGVPTAMKITWARSTAGPSSVVNSRRFCSWLRRTIGSRPGSWMGIWLRCSRSIFPRSLSTHTTSLPVSAKQAPATRPT